MMPLDSLSLAALSECDTVNLLRFQPVMRDRGSHFVEENVSRCRARRCACRAYL
jgi:hypothetical protein